VQVMDVARAIADSAAWHGTPKVRIVKTQPSDLAKQLRDALTGIRWH
jgi:hypothetical protein